MLRCIRPHFLFTCCFVFIFLAASSQKNQQWMPVFNYSIFSELRSTGKFDNRLYRTGRWTDFHVDSAAWHEQILSHDEGRNPYPPHSISIIKAVGDYLHGRREGVWTFYKTYDSQKPMKWELMQTLTFVKGQVIGPWKYYYSTGAVMKEGVFDDSSRTHGKFRIYYPDGSVHEDWNYVHGLAQGNCKVYSYKGVLVWDGTFRDGLYDGEVRKYYSNGKLKSVITYSIGKPWNAIQAVARNGDSLSCGTLREGNGILLVYNEMGALYTRTEYVGGKKNGWECEYFPDGRKNFEKQFRNDTVNGLKRVYFRSGELQSESSFADGKLEGTEKYFHPDGSIFTERIYRNDKIWEVISLNGMHGEKLEIGTFKEGEGYLNVYTDSGKLSMQIRYSGGEKSGVSKEFYPDGTLRVSSEYRAGKKNGTERWYWEDEKLWCICEYKDGKLSGHSRVYHRNGKVFWDQYYLMDRLWNVVAIRDSNGVSKKKGSFKNGCGVLNKYDEGGSVIEKTECLYGLSHGKVTMYYPKGKKAGEYQHAFGLTHGSQRRFYKNGKLMMTYTTWKGNNIDHSVTYHSNGNVWTKKMWLDGWLWSVEFNNDMKGVSRDKGTIHEGTGTVQRYDETEALIFTQEYVHGYCVNCEKDTANPDPH